MNRIFVVFLLLFSFLYPGSALDEKLANCTFEGSNYTNELNISDCVTATGSPGGASAPLIASKNSVEQPKDLNEPQLPAEKPYDWLPFGALAVFLVLTAFVIFSVLMRRPVIEEVEVYKALSSDTRVGIMNELLRGDRIPTDLSSRLGKSKSTIVEHLDKLIEAQLVERIEEPGKKFVFYRLTSKGKGLLRKAA